MKLYLKITKMSFEDDIEHNIIRGIFDKEFLGYDETIELPDDDKFIKNVIRETEEGNVFDVREKNSWWGYPLYELKAGKIIPFDYTQYAYFADTDRRNMLAGRINELYNHSSELKILRKTLKYIMDELNLNYPDEFSIMDTKINEVIEKNPKGTIK